MLKLKLTPQIISAAIDGYEAQKSRIDTNLAELRAMLSGGPAKPAATPAPAKRKRKKMSAAGRKAISEATKRRWATFHAARQLENSEQAAPEKANAKKTASKKSAVTAPPTEAAKKSAPAKKAVTKKTAQAAAQPATEADGQ
jgi:hypothetical protein